MEDERRLDIEGLSLAELRVLDDLLRVAIKTVAWADRWLGRGAVDVSIMLEAGEPPVLVIGPKGDAA